MRRFAPIALVLALAGCDGFGGGDYDWALPAGFPTPRVPEKM